MTKKLFKLGKGWYFELIYFVVAIATFEHTAWAAGTIFIGKPTSEYFSMNDPIWIRGALLAVGIDVAMFFTAKALQEIGLPTRALIALILTFGFTAISSFFMQVYFVYYHTPMMIPSEGLAPYWRDSLQSVVQAAPVLVSLMLPLMATLFTVSRIGVNLVSEPTGFTILVDGQEKFYDSIRGLRIAWKRYLNQGKEIQLSAEAERVLT